MKFYKAMLVAMAVLMMTSCAGNGEATEKPAEEQETSVQTEENVSEEVDSSEEEISDTENKNEEAVIEAEAEEEPEAEPEPEPINWIGKKAIMFGDSITWYDGHKALTGNQEMQYGYESYLREFGFGEVVNAGEDGGCIADVSSSYTDIYTAIMDTDTSDYDLVTIAGGINDYKFFHTPVGELSDGDYDETTFYGALQSVIEKILKENSDGVLVLFTPIQCAGCREENDWGETLADYAEAICQAGAYYELPVLDLYHYKGFTEDNLDGLTLDGIHPNNDGFRRISKKAILPFLAAMTE